MAIILAKDQPKLRPKYDKPTTIPSLNSQIGLMMVLYININVFFNLNKGRAWGGD